MKTREQALSDLGRVVAEQVAIISRLTPLEAAQRAWHPGGPSVEELAHKLEILRRRGNASDTDLLSIGEAAAFLGCGERKLRELRRAGDGPRWFKSGARVQYFRADVVDWLDRES